MYASGAILGALSRLLAGKTLQVIAHRMRTIEAVDKIIVLDNGRVAEEGAPAILRADESSRFRRMTELQTEGAEWMI